MQIEKHIRTANRTTITTMKAYCRVWWSSLDGGARLTVEDEDDAFYLSLSDAEALRLLEALSELVEQHIKKGEEVCR